MWKWLVINPYHYVGVYLLCIYVGFDCLKLILKSCQHRSTQNNLLSQESLPFFPRSRSNVDFWWIFQQLGLHSLDLQFARVLIYRVSQISTSGRIAIIESGSYPTVIEYLGSSTDGASLLFGSTIFANYWFCPVLREWLPLARYGRITSILALIKIASADTTWIYRLVIRLALISFILLK
jgi:hypothetical protein